MLWLQTVVLLVLSSPIVAAFPLRWAIRLWISIALSFVTTVLLQNEVQFHDRGMVPSGVIEGSLSFVLAMSFLVIARRTAHLRHREVSNSTKYRGSDRSLRFFDLIIAIGIGVCAGTFLLLFLAIALRGFPGGLLLHVAVSMTAAIGTAISFHRLQGLLRFAVTSALLVIAGLALAGGFLYPNLVANKVLDVAADWPHCLRAVDEPAQLDQTRLLTLPLGQPGGPGLILTVMSTNGPQHFRWSYRALDFTPYGSYRHGACAS